MKSKNPLLKISAYCAVAVLLISGAVAIAAGAPYPTRTFPVLTNTGSDDATRIHTKYRDDGFFGAYFAAENPALLTGELANVTRNVQDSFNRVEYMGLLGGAPGSHYLISGQQPDTSLSSGACKFKVSAMGDTAEEVNLCPVVDDLDSPSAIIYQTNILLAQLKGRFNSKVRMTAFEYNPAKITSNETDLRYALAVYLNPFHAAPSTIEGQEDVGVVVTAGTATSCADELKLLSGNGALRYGRTSEQAPVPEEVFGTITITHPATSAAIAVPFGTTEYAVNLTLKLASGQTFRQPYVNEQFADRFAINMSPAISSSGQTITVHYSAKAIGRAE